jgi:outer membrane protein TolC
MKFLIVLAVLFLAGCATLSPDAGFSEVEQAVAQRTGAQTQWVRSDDAANSIQARLKEILAKSIGPKEAVQIALLNNPGLQASYADVGVAEADLVQASRWRGPTLSFARLRRGGETEIERSVFFDVLGLITIPLSVRGEAARFSAAKNRAASEALGVALNTRKAWFNAVAARETARYMAQVKEAAEASAELARRMAEVGNWPKLNQAREQAFYAEATAQLARARQAEASAGERLARMMGLWGDDLRFQLPERLPDLPKEPRQLGPDSEAQALALRLDIEAARRDTEALARSLGLTKINRFVSLLEFGLHSNSETGHPRQRGWEIEIGIPIFDFGTARTARAEALYMQSVARAAEAAIQARSEVSDAYGTYRTNFDLARHYRDEVIPLRRRISNEMLLRYNGMLASVFELLADSRDQVTAVNVYIEALRDFWLAESDFQMALTGRSPGTSGAMTGTAAPATFAAGGH